MRIRLTNRRARSAVAAVVVVAASATMLAACGSSQPSSSSTPQTIQITPVAQTGTTVDANVGDTIVVSLDANATTGYSWKFTAGDTFTIVSSKYVPSPAPSGMVGTGGTQVVTLKVTKAGQSDLTGTYRHQWETPSPGTQPDLVLTVVSK